MGFIVRENNTEIGYCKVLVGLRTAQSHQQIAHDVEPRGPLVVGANHDPRRQWTRRPREHRVARLRVVLPVLDRDVVDGAGFPLLQWIIATALERLKLSNRPTLY